MMGFEEHPEGSKCKFNPMVACGWWKLWDEKCRHCGWNPEVAVKRTEVIRDELGKRKIGRGKN